MVSQNTDSSIDKWDKMQLKSTAYILIISNKENAIMDREKP